MKVRQGLRPAWTSHHFDGKLHYSTVRGLGLDGGTIQLHVVSYTGPPQTTTCVNARAAVL